MRILLLGDASNFHRTLATGLRQLGQEVVVASDGTMWMNTERDIDLLRRHSSRLGGLELWWRVKHRLHQRLQGFDIVAIHNPIFLCLRPHRCRYIFDRLRRENRSVFLTALGTDTPYIEECLSPHSTLRYNEFRHYGSPAPLAIEHPETEQAWLTPPLQPHCSHIYAHIDGAWLLSMNTTCQSDASCRRKNAPTEASLSTPMLSHRSESPSGPEK